MIKLRLQDYLSGAEESDLEHFKTNVYETIKMLFPDPDEEEKEKKSEVKESENLEALLSEERHKPESEGVRSEQLNELGEMKPGEPQDDVLSELEELEKLDAGETHKGIFYAALLYSTYRLWLLAHWAGWFSGALSHLFPL